MEDGTQTCVSLNLFWFFFNTVTKAQYIFFLGLLLTSEVARKTPTTQSKCPSATSSSHQSSLSPWFDDESTEGSKNTPLPAAQHWQISSVQLLKPQTHTRVELTAFLVGQTSWKRLSSLPKPPGWARLAQFRGRGQVTKKNKSRNWFGICFGFVGLVCRAFLPLQGYSESILSSLIQNSANMREEVAPGQIPEPLWSRTALERW